MEILKPLLDRGGGSVWLCGFLFGLNQENRVGETHIDYSQTQCLLLKVPDP